MMIYLLFIYSLPFFSGSKKYPITGISPPHAQSIFKLKKISLALSLPAGKEARNFLNSQKLLTVHFFSFCFSASVDLEMSIETGLCRCGRKKVGCYFPYASVDLRNLCLLSAAQAILWLISSNIRTNSAYQYLQLFSEPYR